VNTKMKTSLTILTLLAALAGCAGNNTAVSHGTGTALDAANLVEMTEDMTAKILADPDVQSEMARKNGRLKVVIQPVENRMVGEVLPRGAKEAYVARLRSLLQERAPEKFAWVMNRDNWHALRERELDRGPDPDRVQPEYGLTARFSSITDESSKHRSSYYLCVYTLTDVNSGQELWNGRYEVKKSAVKGFLD
jgi:PBP1b-binding outer membrane lipoprotein LpoB